MLDLIQQWTDKAANLPYAAQVTIAVALGILLLLCIVSAWAAIIISPMVRDDPDWLAGDFIPPAHATRLAGGSSEAGGENSSALNTLSFHGKVSNP